MGLNIVTFVPEGIVIGSDSLSKIRSEEHDVFHSSERTFCVYNRYVISLIGDGYVDGLPYGYMINQFLIRNLDVEFTASKLAKAFNVFLQEFVLHDPVSAYIAGVEMVDNRVVPYLYLVGNGNVTRINALSESDTCELFYNYHAVGRCLWMNKLLLPTRFEDSRQKIKEDFECANIDFRSFSLQQAKDFSVFLLRSSASMEQFTQIHPAVNNTITVAIVQPFSSPTITHI